MLEKLENPNFRIEDHFMEKGSQWTKKYKPIEIYSLIPNCDDYDEDKYTKKMMDKFGIDNVRGGSFSMIKLGFHKKKFLLEMKVVEICVFIVKKRVIFQIIVPKNFKIKNFL